MKHVFFFLILFIAAHTAYSQSDTMRTIFNSIDSHGGYGAYTIRYTIIDGYGGTSTGGRGGWIMDHWFAIGGGGHGFETESFFDTRLQTNVRYTGGYGGVLLEVIAGSKYPVHMAFPVLLGGGGVTYERIPEAGNIGSNTLDQAAFFVAEPGAELDLNLLTFMRVSLGGYYRFSSANNMNYSIADGGGPIASSYLANGLSLGVSFKFGRF